MLVHTRYVSSNVALLFVGAVLCAVIAFEAIMTAGFGADPVHDFKSAAILFDILAAILSIPFFLTMFRWCGIGSVGIWCAAGVSLLCCLITTMSGPTTVLTLLLAFEGVVCSAINTVSIKAASAQRSNV